MTVIEIVTRREHNPDTGEIDSFVDTFASAEPSFMTEPSGALAVFSAPGVLAALYAPGQWVKVAVAQ